MAENKMIKKANDGLTVIIILGILITANFLSRQIAFRFDLTQNGDYSISSATKKVAKELDDVLTIKTYFSRNLPAKYLNLQQEVEDMLEEYSNYSNGRITIDKIDPAKLDNAQEELGNKGIPALQFNVLRNDSFQVVNGYLGLIVEYGGRTEVIPVIDSTKTLEYELTLAIKKLEAKNMPVLGVVTSHGAVDQKTMSQAFSRLKEMYQIKNIDLKTEKVIGSDVSALLVAGVKEKMSDEEMKKIDSFVMSGRPVVFLYDGANVNPQIGATKNQSGLDKLLTAYGANVRNDLVADTSNGRASFSAPGGAYYLTYQINYPLWPKILPENFNKENVMVAGLSSIIMPWASSLDIKQADGRTVTVLAKTTDKAIVQTDKFNLEPDNAFKDAGVPQQYDLAALITGKIASPFGQGEIENAKIIVVGDSDFASDNFSGPVSDNLVFFQNIIDGLTLDSDLINIRSKSAVERPIKVPGNGPKEAMRYLNILGFAVLALIFGLARYFLRRRPVVYKADSLSAKGGIKGLVARIFRRNKAIVPAAPSTVATIEHAETSVSPISQTPSSVVASPEVKSDYSDIKN
jgi:gliding-associated putative ABC transporter substrate-binding component GldG